MLDNKNYYPTPNDLIRRMIEKIDIRTIKYILEPSAGSSSIIDYYKQYYKSHSSRYMRDDYNVDDYISFDAIELDKNLSDLLKGKNINVVWDDFLTFQPQRFYSLIIMNPPYDNGCEHVLKAIRIQERIGGKIVTLLNGETLKNPYSNNRKTLVNLLKQYNADIEYIPNAFSDAERKTDVETALIYIDVPMTNDETIFEKEFKRDSANIGFSTFQALIPNMNKLETLIFECDMIKKSTIELFKEKFKIDKLLEGMKLKSKIQICDDCCKPNILSINSFINKINLEYWQKFIEETDFKNRLPSKLKNSFSYNMEKQEDISFNMENVKYFYEKLIKSIPQSYEETVAKVFDDLTHKYVYTDSTWNTTIHYYSGWKTNKAYKINKKVIIKCYHESMYHFPDELMDLNIIFENISGIKDKIDDNKKDIRGAIERCEKNIETEFFTLDSYKKQTLHITFKNQEYLDQFNILASKGKNWLPSDFGKKSYDDMDENEQLLIENFGITATQYTKYSKQKDYLRLQ